MQTGRGFSRRTRLPFPRRHPSYPPRSVGENNVGVIRGQWKHAIEFFLRVRPRPSRRPERSSTCRIDRSRGDGVRVFRPGEARGRSRCRRRRDDPTGARRGPDPVIVVRDREGHEIPGLPGRMDDPGGEPDPLRTQASMLSREPRKPGLVPGAYRGGQHSPFRATARDGDALAIRRPGSTPAPRVHRNRSRSDPRRRRRRS